MPRMKTNTDKKLVSFTKLSLIEALVKDEALMENRSESAIIEKHLLDSFLPIEKNARFWVESCLYSQDGSIGKTLHAIFSCNAAGLNWKSVHSNLLPIVQFAKTQQCLCNTIPTGKEPELYHFRSQVDSVCLKLEELAKEGTDTCSEYKNEAKWARHLLKEATEEPQFIRYSNFYQILLNSWDDFKDWSITYRLLADMALLEKGWIDSPETRKELLELIKEVSNEWVN